MYFDSRAVYVFFKKCLSQSDTFRSDHLMWSLLAEGQAAAAPADLQPELEAFPQLNCLAEGKTTAACST